MRLTIWQFLALIGVLVGGYLVYDMWISKQDQNSAIRGMNSYITGEPTGGTQYKNDGTATQPTSGEGETTPSPW